VYYRNSFHDVRHSNTPHQSTNKLECFREDCTVECRFGSVRLWGRERLYFLHARVVHVHGRFGAAGCCRRGCRWNGHVILLFSLFRRHVILWAFLDYETWVAVGIVIWCSFLHRRCILASNKKEFFFIPKVDSLRLELSGTELQDSTNLTGSPLEQQSGSAALTPAYIQWLSHQLKKNKMYIYCIIPYNLETNRNPATFFEIDIPIEPGEPAWVSGPHISFLLPPANG